MLGLKTDSDAAWVSQAMADLDRVLVDHAHCEMKAASNAISLATRWPGTTRTALALTALAEEELQHFRAVLRLLDERGIALGVPSVDAYAAELRAITSTPHKRSPAAQFADRLLVGALIEARSCERFRLLAEALARRADPLATFYDELFACEARHYRTLVDLAIEVLGDEDAARARLGELARREGELAATLGRRATIHG